MTFTDRLNQIIRGQNLTEDQATNMISDIFSGTITPVQTGAFMAALATKGETFEELAGAARAMRRKATRIQTLSRKVIDTCGTGWDASGSFNISTTTAFVVAGAGVTMAKHCNRSISSQCGSADVLEALGGNLYLYPEIVEEAVNEIGIGFLFAPHFHGAMKYAAQARKECGIRSIFNMLGMEKAFVVHGHDGLDEITTTDLTRVSELSDGHIKSYDLDPLNYFEEYADPADLAGGDARTNADIITLVLSGKTGPRRDIVLLNAGTALVAAADAIDSGRAMEKLSALIRFSRENA